MNDTSPVSSEAVTRRVRVFATPHYLAERFDPVAGLRFWTYEIVIRNEGESPVQLLSRHWIITDASGHEEHVRGPGVIGEQPVILPGGTYRYASGCRLETAMGTMHGTYQMIAPATGERFDVEIAPFTLAEPFAIN